MANTGSIRFEITPIIGDALIATEIANPENSHFVYTTDGGTKTWVGFVPSEITYETIQTETEYYYGGSGHVQNSILAGENIEATSEQFKSLFYLRVFSKLWTWQRGNTANRITIRDYNNLTPPLTLNTDTSGLVYVVKTGLITSVNSGGGRARLLRDSQTRPRIMDGMTVSFMAIF